METCTVGKKLDDECHKNTHCRKAGINVIEKLPEIEIKLLKIRTGLNLTNTDYLCLHHEQVYLQKYTSRQCKCCDPFSNHKIVKACSYKITIKDYEKFNGIDTRKYY